MGGGAIQGRIEVTHSQFIYRVVFIGFTMGMDVTRRELCGACVTLAIAGCTTSGDSGSTDSDGGRGDPKVNERLRGGGDEMWNVEAGEGDTIEVYIDNEAGYATIVGIQDPNGEMVVEEDVETEATIVYEVEEIGVHRIWAGTESRASITVWVY